MSLSTTFQAKGFSYQYLVKTISWINLDLAKRVLNGFHERSDDYYGVKEPAFCHDVGVCCLRNIPVGGAWVVCKSGIGLRFF